MAFRGRVDAGRQVRRILGRLRDSDVVALGEPCGRHGECVWAPPVAMGIGPVGEDGPRMANADRVHAPG